MPEVSTGHQQPTRMGIAVGNELVLNCASPTASQYPVVLVESGLAPLVFPFRFLHKHCFMCPPTFFSNVLTNLYICLIQFIHQRIGTPL